MKQYLTIIFCLFSISCLNDVEDSAIIIENLQYDTLYEVVQPPPASDTQHKQEENPCDVIKEYDVYGRTIRILTWCDPNPYIYKGCPPPNY